ncbi:MULTISPECIES: flagellar assembly protein FliW [unclassified Candidatus Frackibacter]|uniref:flagellar assembly protein FliW n=1 Tax=unclassified Candidatus Frackibacter TaxID=2648818 RepID=UPI0008917087|nr:MULTISPECIES: flagellar assembly protein FliW [unclassified Candidatus Frackibacter]SDC72579.1 flagellar assembly factor FliW [Candidatus Frackibacter sp. WG11]SEM86847.1 flagellar assembly factor FliW [Candidatus Frackibacter sp. WG12]SFL95881.1 flagellar assembly factor FliW [Candidatus Frackibacter sp. WG13]
MELKTTRFGKIEIDPDEVISFKQGLYGFKDNKEFILLMDDETPFCWLQAIDNPDLAFVVTEPWNYCEDYEFDLDNEVKKELKIEEKQDVLVVNIVVVSDNLQDMTMNLKAPVIINKNEQIAKQIILDDDDYSVKYKLFNDEENISA